MAEEQPSKISNVLSGIFVVVFILFAVGQFAIIFLTDTRWIVKIATGVIGIFIIVVIVYLIIEKRKEPPIKY